ncbi:MAG TPA: HlyD family efflux transporter periplasmic adaptor subunit [Ensifer sp.]|jgi:hypothetical protein|uniref:efflux RND transporter periplasmic adaptor subunit n=1 Tax=Ensifer sp. TaxID=1872086 RepID=UPI002E11BC03|nr:HlyD family efflux transporter periplasmic adaptor subunit [Ensifer sp.]
MSDLHSQQLTRLTALIMLEKRARAASPAELGFIMVNETGSVVKFRQAMLWQGQPSGQIMAASGLAATDRNAPYIVWAAGLFRHIADQRIAGIRELRAGDLPLQFRAEWQEWFAPILVWVPLDGTSSVLVLGRDEPLREGDKALLEIIADAYGHAWRAHLARRGLRARAGETPRRWTRLIAAAALLLLIAAGFLPVRQSILAPAEIVPQAPAAIRAPLDGVVDTVHVRPNETVTASQLLFSLDPRRIRNQLEVSSRALEAAEAELRQALQASVSDPKVRATLPALQGKLDQQQTEANFLKAQLERIEVRSPEAGLAVFDDPNDWLGRPVVIGERVMLIADPSKVEVDIRVPSAEAIDVESGSPVRLFLNIEPERVRDGEVTFASYQPQKGLDGIVSYRVKASLKGDDRIPRIGLKGTAKLYGPQVPLAYYILRRPLASARQWLGL